MFANIRYVTRERPLLIAVNILGDLPHHTIITPHSLLTAVPVDSGDHIVNVLSAIFFVCEQHRDDFPRWAIERTYDVEEFQSFGVPASELLVVLNIGKVFLLQHVEVVMGEGKGYMPQVALEPLCDRLPEILDLGRDRGRSGEIVLLVEVHGVEGHRVCVEPPRQREVHSELQQGTGLGGG